ncbi:Transglycosylase-like domain protein [Actinobacteria bacterium OK074]|nr:Transglycosylase-like domain protein [Actinobacteria bacterium OK074]
MLSGNGRHRRPRQAPALLVTAGVTGSAIAIPLLGATAASAASGTTWDKVANCESDGSWSADTDNGRYGGLQLTQQQWDDHGGLDYASRPDLASRSQQIAVAEKLLADEGTAPWSLCAVTSGLTKDSGSADVDTGVADDSPSTASSDDTTSDTASGTSGSTDSSDASGSSDDSSGSLTYDPGLSDSADSSDSSGSSGSADNSSTPSPSSSPSSSTAADNSAKPSKSGKSGDSGKTSDSGSKSSQESDSSGAVTPEQAAGSSNLVDTGAIGTGRHRGASAEATTKAKAAKSGVVAKSAAGTYTVRAGDSLVSIADSLGVQGGWRALYAENKKAIGTDPSHIAPGQRLVVGVETVEK